MRKLKEFNVLFDQELSKVELTKVVGGLYATSRYSCWTDTASAGCTDSRRETTTDHNDGTITTTVSETDYN